MSNGRDRSAEIAVLTKQLGEFYVYPDVAERICQVLWRRLADGGYRDLADDEAFAQAATIDLRSVNGDRHLRLIYSADEVPGQQEPEQDGGARYRRAAELAGCGIAKVEWLPGNVALLEVSRLFDAAIAGASAVAAMNLVAGADVLLLDLRRNQGGQPTMVALLCSYLLDEPTHLNDLYNRAEDRTRQWWSHAFVPGPRFGGTKPIYVLTSSRTFSGAEELTYNLQQLGRATVVGETTGGGAHPNGHHRVGSHLVASIPWGKAINPVSGTNWEGTGIKPDITGSAEEAFATAYKLALEHVLRLDADSARAAQVRQALSGLEAG